ncbi:MAG: polysaccharide deacetylase family protein [Candidatus Margulisiibacteriota bacterium]
MSVTNGTIRVLKAITPQKISAALLEINVYLHTALSTINASPGTGRIYIAFSSTGFETSSQIYASMNYNQIAREGWNLLYRDLLSAPWSVVGGESIDNLMTAIRVTMISNGDVTAEVSVDSIHINSDRLPRIAINFDDPRPTIYTHAYPLMESLGIKGTIYVCANDIGNADRCTWEQLQEMDASGVMTCCNHTMSHTYNIPSASKSLAEYEILGCRDIMQEKGLIRGLYHHAYPGGGYSENYISWLQEWGFLTGRAGMTGPQEHTPNNLFHLRCSQFGSGTTLDGAKLRANSGIRSGTMPTILFHNLTLTLEEMTDPATDWYFGYFEELLNFIISLRVKCPTIPEWYKGLTNPRYRSLPLSRSAA